ncbi:MAG: AAA family ATPase [Clostridia bacterium]
MNAILHYLPSEVGRKVLPYLDRAREIRLMSTGVSAVVTDREIIDLGAPVSAAQIKNTLNYICRGAVYSYQNTLREGFVTLEGGHRVGVCGRLAGGEEGALLEPSALCFRIARQIVGAAEKIEKYLWGNVLIISPPGCGKTTLLRDAARLMGNRCPVCIVDERSEIAAVYQGVPQMDVGKYTCVLDGVKKSAGMLTALRSMSPVAIVTDEIGADSDVDAIYSLVNAGVRIITSVHGYGEEDVRRRGRLGQLIDEKIFSAVIVLWKLGEIKEVIAYA